MYMCRPRAGNSCIVDIEINLINRYSFPVRGFEGIFDQVQWNN